MADINKATRTGRTFIIVCLETTAKWTWIIEVETISYTLAYQSSNWVLSIQTVDTCGGRSGSALFALSVFNPDISSLHEMKQMGLCCMYEKKANGRSGYLEL